MRTKKSIVPSIVSALGLASLIGLAGCSGMNHNVSQTLGINSGARVPPPATGSFNAPNNYSGTPASGQPASGPNPTTNTTSQFTPLAQPTERILSSIDQAQSQFTQATDRARNSIHQTANELNSRVSSANERIDRFNQGVVQASAIMQDAIQSPPQPNTAPVGSGVASQIDADQNAAWRKPAY